MEVNLVDVESAIAQIQEGGQSVTLDGFTYSAASLAALASLRDTLKAEELRSTGARPVFRRFKLSNAAYGSSSTNSDSIVRTVTA